MSVFALEAVQAKVTAVTPRAEIHGPELVPAMSIMLVAIAPAATMSPLDVQLNKICFRKPGKEESVQGELPGTTSNEGHTALRFPKIKSHMWEEKLTGYAIKIGSGLSTTGGLFIDMVDIKHLVITPKEGGIVEYKIPCAFKVDSELAGDLAMLVGQTVEVTLAPRSETQEEINA